MGIFEGIFFNPFALTIGVRELLTLCVIWCLIRSCGCGRRRPDRDFDEDLR